MIPVTVYVKSFTFLSIVALCTAQPTSEDVDITSLNEQVKKMDVLFHQFQSHSQDQEEQYRRILSNILSQLIQTTTELNTSRNLTTELQEEIRIIQKEYTSAMDELAELKQSHNQTLVELEMVKGEFASIQQDLKNVNGSLLKSDSLKEFSQLNSTEAEVLVSLAGIVGEMNATGYIQLTDSKQPFLHEDIGFEAVLHHTKTFSTRLVFNKVKYNVGNGYNRANGYFTAPVSGTYLFWTNIVFTGDKGSSYLFTIQTDDTVHFEAYGIASERNGVASATSIIYLNEGERTSIHASKEVEVQDKGSSAGAVLIK